jgi:hypothetical protein
MSCHSVAVVPPLVQTKQIRINTRKPQIKTHSTNNIENSKYKYTYYQNTQALQNPYTHTHTHITKQVKTTTVQDTPK